jgi:cell division protein FtsL
MKYTILALALLFILSKPSSAQRVAFLQTETGQLVTARDDRNAEVPALKIGYTTLQLVCESAQDQDALLQLARRRAQVKLTGYEGTRGWTQYFYVSGYQEVR